MKCPYCNNEENFHVNYNYANPKDPNTEVLCNECGKFFDTSHQHEFNTKEEENKLVDGSDFGEEMVKRLGENSVKIRDLKANQIKGRCKDCIYCNVKESFHDGGIHLCYEYIKIPRAVKPEGYCSDWEPKLKKETNEYVAKIVVKGKTIAYATHVKWEVRCASGREYNYMTMPIKESISGEFRAIKYATPSEGQNLNTIVEDNIFDVEIFNAYSLNKPSKIIGKITSCKAVSVRQLIERGYYFKVYEFIGGDIEW